MKLFLDTANLDDIRAAAKLGVIHGVTTNPTLISREKGDFAAIIREITSLVDGPVFAEVLAHDAEGMIREGRELADGDFETEVVAASVRSPLHAVEAAKAGADIATVPPKALFQMIHHPLTDAGLARFMKDWAESGKEL